MNGMLVRFPGGAPPSALGARPGDPGPEPPDDAAAAAPAGLVYRDPLARPGYLAVHIAEATPPRPVYPARRALAAIVAASLALWAAVVLLAVLARAGLL